MGRFSEFVVARAHHEAGQLMNARDVVAERCELFAEHIERLENPTVFQALEILLLLQQELHLNEAVRVDQYALQLVQVHIGLDGNLQV